MFRSVTDYINLMQKHGVVVMCIGILSIVFLSVVPLQPALLDSLLSLCIVLVFATLIIAIFTKETLERNAFPSLLLFLTLFRLGLQVASMRMIIYEARAGDIIRMAGNFVAKKNITLGFVVFVSVMVLNFFIIMKISRYIAKKSSFLAKKNKKHSEIVFYKAMVGTSLFVRGDAIACIIITIVGVVASIVVGFGLKEMTFSGITSYFVLIIGNGLVYQILSLLVAFGAYTTTIKNVVVKEYVNGTNKKISSK